MLKTNAEMIRTEIEGLYRTTLRKGLDSDTGLKYAYLRSSSKRNGWQHMWDACFHAVVMAHVVPEQAVAELRTLIATQDDDGFIGDTAFWGSRKAGDWLLRSSNPKLWRSRHTSMIHPPVLAQVVARVAELIGDAWFPVEMMAALDNYHMWLSNNRVPDSDGLMVVFAPSETGAGYSPSLDAARGLGPDPSGLQLAFKSYWLDVRNGLANYNSRKLLNTGRFIVKDVLVNSLYAESLATMARLHHRQGSRNVANAYATRAGMVTASLVDKLWDRGQGAFFSLYGREERRASVLTSSSLMPLVVEGLPREAVEMLAEGLLRQRARFWLPNPIPSVAADERTFKPRGSGQGSRGASQVTINWLLWRGLKRQGLVDLAEQIASKTVNMVAKAGLREYYHPYTGVGLGAERFTRSGLALDMF